ncbi:MAG: hypothetical protein ACKV2T_30500 [Kofleriaceae bacterium]
MSSSIATVVSLSGDVRIRRAGTTAWIPASLVSTIHTDDMIQTLGTGSVLLRVTKTGGELAMGASTTMRFDASPRPHAVDGKFVAKSTSHLAHSTTLEVATPPGVVVLSSPVGGPSALASIEIDGPATTVELLAGKGTMHAPDGEVSLELRRPVTFGGDDSRGGDTRAAEPAVVALRAPVANASLRVRQRVTFDWKPVANADRYDILLSSGSVVRSVDVASPPSAVGLTTGSYVWQVRAYRAERVLAVSKPREFKAVVDSRPPPLTIVSPRDGAVVSGPRLEITGTTEPGAIIEAARSSRAADANGAFAISVPITRGLANIVVSASDDLGNVKHVTRSVVCE